jgi:predicted nucleic acid-binding protein
LSVVDASALIEVLLRTPASTAVESHLFASGQTLHAPHLLDIEVAQVIRKYAARGEIDAERGRVALSDLDALPMRRYPHDFLLPRVWSLRSDVAAYDVVHIALAEALDAVLLTRDHRLAGATAPCRSSRRSRSIAAPPPTVCRSAWRSQAPASTISAC